MKDGYLGKCKDCAKEDSIKHYREKWKDPEWRKLEKNRGKEKYGRLYKGVSQKRDPIKRSARSKVSNALRDGRIQKPEFCEDCGTKEKLEAHHQNYTKQLDIRWLCTLCHGKTHRIVLSN